MSKVAKPITIAVRDTKEGMVKALQESNLHVSMLLPIVKEVYDEVSKIHQEVESKEYAKYMEDLKNAEVEEEVVIDE